MYSYITVVICTLWYAEKFLRELSPSVEHLIGLQTELLRLWPL